MEFSIKVSAPENAKTSCLAVGVFESGILSVAATSIDRASGGLLKSLLESGDIQGKYGFSRMLFRVHGVVAERVLIIGLGKKENFRAKEYCDAIRNCVIAVSGSAIKDVWVSLAETEVNDRDSEWKARHLVIAASEALYRFEEMKSKKSKVQSITSITLGLRGAGERSAFEPGLVNGRAIAAGMNLAKDLGNLPGNVCTPSYLAKTAENLAKQHGLKVELLERKDMERLKMGALISVAKGSREAPKFIVISHRGAAKNEKPIVLIGKGVTFDSGGLSIKPTDGMLTMKCDMAGAATVLGAMTAIARLKLPVNVIGYCGLVENMLGAKAYKLGDILTARNGVTIEVHNTDAEGRLVINDVLSYAVDHGADRLIDLATLTGACVVALGEDVSGAFTNNQAWCDQLFAAAKSQGEDLWQLPMFDSYNELLKSDVADCKNIGGRWGGAITAAKFLEKFVAGKPWVHLDIAGPAFASASKGHREGGATGCLVRTLVEVAEKGQL